MLDITGTNIQLEKLLQYEHKQVENIVVMKQLEEHLQETLYNRNKRSTV